MTPTRTPQQDRKLSEDVQILTGERGDPLDRAVRFRDLGPLRGGVVKAQAKTGGLQARVAALETSLAGALAVLDALTAPDTTPPVLTGLAFSGGSASATMNEAGTLFYLFRSSPTIIGQAGFAAAMGSALVAGSIAVGAGLTVFPINTSALTTGTWYLHVLAQDSAGNRAATSVVSGAYTV